MSIRKLVAILMLCPAMALANPDFWKHEWPETDFGTTTIDNWVEILSGGPPKDGIPALSDPQFVSVSQETRIGGREPVIAVEMPGERARSYPLRYLTWHEIVNDTIGATPIAVTFCPLCNSALTFDRRVADRVLTFGVSGKLRNSDMIMYDRETQSWWQQAIGTAVVGMLTGTELRPVVSWMEDWDSFRHRNPDGLVMAQPPHNRPYGRNPYEGYDSAYKPFLYSGEFPPHDIDPLARVVRVGNKAWPLDRLRTSEGIKEDGIEISWTSGQASALDTAEIGQGKDVGTIRVRDAAGADLPHDVMFAFAFHAFWPTGIWMLGD